MVDGPRVVIRLVGGPAHDFVMSVPPERVPPFVAVGAGQPVASYYPDLGQTDVRIYRYAPDVMH